jgi:hypothetical protein
MTGPAVTMLHQRPTELAAALLFGLFVAFISVSDSVSASPAETVW